MDEEIKNKQVEKFEDEELDDWELDFTPKRWHESMSDLWGAIAIGIVIMAVVFGCTQCCRCTSEYGHVLSREK